MDQMGLRLIHHSSVPELPPEDCCLKKKHNKILHSISVGSCILHLAGLLVSEPGQHHAVRSAAPLGWGTRSSASGLQGVCTTLRPEENSV